MAWLAQILMFVTLGLLSFPSRLWEAGGKAMVICLVLMLVARPLAVMICGLPFRFRWRELTFMSWVGLKGAVPITLATFPLMFATREAPMQAAMLFDVVFFIVVVSAVVQGTSLTPVARWLGLECPRDPEPPVTLEISSLRHVEGEVLDYHISEESRAAGRQVRELALPGGVVIAMVAREDKVIPPQGSTRIQAGDHVILVLQPGTEPLVERVFGTKLEEPAAVPEQVEFPFRGSTTIGELQEFYSLRLDAPPASTLDEILRGKLGPGRTAPNEAVDFGPLRFRVLLVSSEGRVELVGMAILAEEEDVDSEGQGAGEAVEERVVPPG